MKFKLVCLLIFMSVLNYAQVTADFSMSDNEGCVPMNIVFTNTSSGNSLSYSWNFGNGNISDIENPEANYGNVGSFTVTLTVTDGTDSDEISKIVNVYDKPNASFTPTTFNGCVGDTINFESTSTGAEISQWVWDFKDGSYPPNVNAINQIYSFPGVYDISLEVFDVNGCSDFVEVFDVFNIASAPSFSYTASETYACEFPLDVSFAAVINDAETSTYTYLWDLGDGTNSTSPTPSITYSSYDFFDVSLELTNANGCKSTSSSPNVMISEIASGFYTESGGVTIESGDTVCPNQTVLFADTSIGSGNIQWKSNGVNFGSGFYASKAYSTPGNKSITHSITSVNGACIDSTVFSFYVDEIVANFGPDLDTLCSPYNVIQFTDSSINASTWIYVWGDGDSSFVQNPTHSFEVPYPVDAYDDIDFEYTLIASNSRGCTDAKSYEINFNMPFAEFVSDLEVGPPPLDVQFTNLSSPSGELVSFSWLHNGVEFSTSENPDFTFYQVGTHDIQLVVVNETGCLDTSIVRNIYVGGPVDADDFEVECEGGS